MSIISHARTRSIISSEWAKAQGIKYRSAGGNFKVSSTYFLLTRSRTSSRPMQSKEKASAVPRKHERDS